MADQNFRIKRGLEVGTGGTSLFVSSGGNIGIGTTNPLQNLHIGLANLFNSRVSAAGTVGITTDTITGINTTGIETGYFVQSNTNGILSAGTTVTSIGDSQVVIGTDTLNEAIVTGETFDFGLFDDDSNATTFTSDGKIGLGVTNPNSKLSIDGTLNVSGITTFNSNVHIGTGITINQNSGIISATKFVGDGADLSELLNQKIEGVNVRNSLGQKIGVSNVAAGRTFADIHFLNDFVTSAISPASIFETVVSGLGTVGITTDTITGISTVGIESGQTLKEIDGIISAGTTVTSVGDSQVVIGTDTINNAIVEDETFTFGTIGVGESTVTVSIGTVTNAQFAGTATNIAAGSTGDIPYQSDVGTTTYVSSSGRADGKVLMWNDTSGVPEWKPITAAADALGITVKEGDNVVGNATSITELKFTGVNFDLTDGGAGSVTITAASDLIGDSIGIGTTNPLQIVHVNSTNTFSVAVSAAGTVGITTDKITGINTAGIETGFTVQSTTNGILSAGTTVTSIGDSQVVIGTDTINEAIVTGETFKFGPFNDARVAVITSDGKIGLGTTNPQASIHILRQDTPEGGSSTEIHADLILENPGEGNARIFLKTRDNNRDWEFFADDDDGSFGIHDGVANKRTFAISTSSYIGIGTVFNSQTQPVQQLDVRGGAYVSGNVGLGTTNPTSKLHVDGNIKVSGTGIVTATTFVGGLTGTATSLSKSVSAGSGLTGGGELTQSRTISIGTGIGISVSHDYIALKNGNNLTNSKILQWNDTDDQLTDSIIAGTATSIGIGTTAPLSTLEIHGDLAIVSSATTDGTRIAIGYTTDNNGTIEFTGNSGTLFSVTNDTLSDGYIFAVDDVSGIPSLDINADGTIRLAPNSNDTSEFVGIGTTNPTSKLQVDGTLKVNGISTINSSLHVTGLTTTNNFDVTGISTFNGNVIVKDGSLNGNSGASLRIGDDADIRIYRESTASHIHNENDSLNITSNSEILFKDKDNNTYAKFIDGGAVELYHNGNKKFETTSTGIAITSATATAEIKTGTGVTTLEIDPSPDGVGVFQAGVTTTGDFTTLDKDTITDINTTGITAGMIVVDPNGTHIPSNDYSYVVDTVNTGNPGSIVLNKDLINVTTGSGDYEFEFGNLSSGLVVIKGDLQVDGTQTVINSTILEVDDKLISIAKSATNASTADGAGLEVHGANATITYNHNGGGANEQWVFNKAPYYNTYQLLTSNDTLDADTLGSNSASYFINTSTTAQYKDGNLAIGTDSTTGIGETLYVLGNFKVESGTGVTNTIGPIKIVTDPNDANHGIVTAASATGIITYYGDGQYLENVNTSGNAATATTATNLDGGTAGQIPYQTGDGATSFIAAGQNTQVLRGGTTPSFVNINTLTVAKADEADQVKVASSSDSSIHYITFHDHSQYNSYEDLKHADGSGRYLVYKPNSGYLGIRTDSPSHQLHVVGEIGVQASTTNTARFEIKHNNTANSLDFIYHT